MDLQDASFSLSQFLKNRAEELSMPNLAIYPGPSIVPKDRPALIMQTVPGALSQRLTRYTINRVQRYNIMFLTSGGMAGYNQALRWNSAIEKKLANNNWVINGILVDFVFPRPAIKVVEDDSSTLPTGTYYVAVSGLNAVDETEETLPSVVQAVAITAAERAIELVIPRYEGGVNWFQKYNVWIGTNPNQLRKLTGMPIAADPQVTRVYRITHNNVVAGSSPVTQTTLKNRILTIPEDTFDSAVINEPTNEAGNFMGLITLALEYPLRGSDPFMKPDYPVIGAHYEFNQ